MFRPDLEPTVDQPTAVEARVTLAQITAHEEATLRNRHHTRHLLNQKFLQALLLDFDANGREAIEECRKQSPFGYVKEFPL